MNVKQLIAELEKAPLSLEVVVPETYDSPEAAIEAIRISLAQNKVILQFDDTEMDIGE